jgi:hypothetical protein
VRRIKLFAAAAAISATAAVGVAAAPASAATIGTPPGVILALCITIRPNPPALCVYI